MMKKPILLLIALALVTALPACGKKKIPPPPPPPAPVAPEAPPPAPPPPEQPQVAPQVDEYARLQAMSADEIEKLGLLGNVYFDYDSADIRDSERATLAKDADVLKKYDFLRVTIEGHCDERGTIEYNIALGERRAQAVINYLVTLGVPAQRLKNVSYGKEVPVCSESNEACWRQNRRAKPTVTSKVK
jgi:peptidoglycan-associated lipoprotein